MNIKKVSPSATLQAVEKCADRKKRAKQRQQKSKHNQKNIIY